MVLFKVTLSNGGSGNVQNFKIIIELTLLFLIRRKDFKKIIKNS